MARVFDAFDDRLERPVAVKILRPATEALPGMRKRFQQEARLAARLIHPHIVAVLDYGEDDASVLPRDGTAAGDHAARRDRPRAADDVESHARHHRSALRTGGRPQVRGAASRRQTQQHPPAGRRPHKDHRLRDCQERRHPDRGGGGDRGHDAHRGRPGHARLSRARTEIGPPGDGTVRSLLGRRRHGGGTHGAASRSRCHPDGGATSLAARHRPSSAGGRAERAVRVSGGDAARPAAPASDGRRGAAGHDAADGAPACRDPPCAGR